MNPQRTRHRSAIDHHLIIVVAALMVFGGVFTSIIGSEPARAAFPGLAGRIAFIAPAKLGSDANTIEMMNANGSGVATVRVVPGATSLAWSPNGQMLAFAGVSARSLDTVIYVMNADGTGLKKLTDSSTAVNTPYDGAPTWSPDGKSICFTRMTNVSPGHTVPQLMLMNADGTNQRSLFADPTGQDIEPAWSPDGSLIAFARNPVSGGPDQIYTVSANGSGLSPLTNDSAHNDAPDWSPDGSKIVFQSDQSSFTPNIWVMDANGSAATQLTTASTTDGTGDLDPSWSPDGSRIVYWSNLSGTGQGDIEVMASDGSAQTPLTSTSTQPETHPRWQPLPLTIRSSRSLIHDGQGVTLSMHLFLHDQTTNEVVSIYGSSGGGAPFLVASRSVDPSGNLTLVTKPRRNTAFYGVWSGDSSHFAVQSASAAVEVYASVSGRLSRAYRTVGTLHLYHVGARVPFTGTVAPNHAGEPLDFILERRGPKGWKAIRSAKARLRKGSTALVVAIGFSEGSYREACAFRGDKYNLGSSSTWSYLRITP